MPSKEGNGAEDFMVYAEGRRPDVAFGGAQVPINLENVSARQLWSSSLPPTLPVSPLSLLFGELNKLPTFLLARWFVLLWTKPGYLYLRRAVRARIGCAEVYLFR